MKKFKLGLVLLSIIAMTGIANASGVGYIDYIKVIDNYDYAKKVTKEVDAKGLEMQQYLVDKEKEYKALDTPLKKQTFEQKTAQEFKTKEQAYIALKQGYKDTPKLREELIELCKKNLAAYSVPKEFEFRKSLPKTMIGKVDFRKLQQENAEKRAEERYGKK